MMPPPISDRPARQFFQFLGSVSITLPSIGGTISPVKEISLGAPTTGSCMLDGGGCRFRRDMRCARSCAARELGPRWSGADCIDWTNASKCRSVDAIVSSDFSSAAVSWPLDRSLAISARVSSMHRRASAARLSATATWNRVTNIVFTQGDRHIFAGVCCAPKTVTFG